MAAPLGNKNGVGNKGGGRPSAYVEAGRAKLLVEMFYDDHDIKKIRKKIIKGKFSIRDRHIENALKGEQTAINPIFNKLHPDKMEMKEETTIKIDI